MAYQNYSPPEIPVNICTYSSNVIDPFPVLSNEISFKPNSDKSLTELFLNKLNFFSPFLESKNEKPSYKTPVRKSTRLAWSRVFSKYSPTTETDFSPLKPSQVNLQSVLVENDDYINISTWILNMSEQFFYDNTLILMNNFKTNVKQMEKMLKQNRVGINIKFFEELENIVLLGEGGYGKVYSATDPNTKKKYAVKYVAPESEELTGHCRNILNYMSERNSTVRAHDSPFVVKFYHSFQTKFIPGLFLFFEFCIGDLYTYITNIVYCDYNEIAERLKANDSNIILDIDDSIKVLEISLVYIFELFSGLDFLVKSNIIHQDIKPDNLMISEMLHLKIGDFGLIYRTRAIHKKSNRLLVKHSEIDKVESSDYRTYANGTEDYEDFETKLIRLHNADHPDIERFLHDKVNFNTPGISFKDEVLKPTFLTDTWAAGVVAVNLLFRGFDIFDPAILETQLFEGVPQYDMAEYMIHVVGKQKIYRQYILNGFIKAGGEYFKDLMEFLASIFQPRTLRSKNYVKEKYIYQFSRKRSIKYIDMGKVENIKCFKDRNFNIHNILLIAIPERIREFFESYKTSDYRTFKDMLRYLSRMSDGEENIDLTPGLVINNYV